MMIGMRFDSVDSATIWRVVFNNEEDWELISKLLTAESFMEVTGCETHGEYARAVESGVAEGYEYEHFSL